MKPTNLRNLLALGTIILLAAGLPACSLLTDEMDGDQLEIHLQSSFSGERVQVMIDGILVYDAEVSTDQRIGLADVIQLQRTQGRHQIEVVVDGRYHVEESFQLRDRLFIAVSFFEQSIPEAGLEEGVHLAFLDSTINYD